MSFTTHNTSSNNNNQTSQTSSDHNDIVFVEFEWKYDSSRNPHTTVYLAGEWNSWRPLNPMQRFCDSFLEVVPLKPGRYEYKFVVNGKWCFDIERPNSLDFQGNVNNYITVLQPNFVPEGPPKENLSLGELKLENLNEFTKFDLFELEYKTVAPPGIETKQVWNGSHQWNFPKTFSEKSEHGPNSMELEILFPSVRHIDAVDLEVTMALWPLSLSDDLGADYTLTLKYFDGQKGWLTALDQCELNSYIQSGFTKDKKSDNRKARKVVINVDIIARRLIAVFTATARAELPIPVNKPQVHHFKFNHDFDMNGILYYIGTDHGREKTWTNPASSNKVKIDISHPAMSSSSMKKDDIISRSSVPAYWGGSAPTWFTLDLGPDYRVMCDCYTLRHGYNSTNSYIQNWQFLGSVDAQNWVVLHEGGETPFKKAFDTKSFPIKDGKEYFRYFKILMKGNFSMGLGSTSSGSPVLCVSGFEIYGNLIHEAKGLPNVIEGASLAFCSLNPVTQNNTKEFHYREDFDQNGVLYYFGTDMGRSGSWINPVLNGKVKLELSHASMYTDQMKKEDVVSRVTTASTYWGGSAPCWFMVDLGPDFHLHCSHYTLRHGYCYANSFIYDWCFQGSHDGKDWVTLHEDVETPFSTAFETITFKIKDPKDFYRYFRVLQKGSYSMGKGQTGGGSPILCINGFEIYGVSKSTPRKTSGVTIPQEVEKTRRMRRLFYSSQDFHLQLVKAVQEPNLSSEHRRIILDLLLDIRCKATTSTDYLVSALDLRAYLLHNIVESYKPVCVKGSRLLLRISQRSKEFKDKLLEAVLDVLKTSVNKLMGIDSMTQFLKLLKLSWESDAEKSHATCLEVLFSIGQSLYNNRSPFYNILRTYYGLHAHVLEAALFGRPKVEKKKEEEHVTPMVLEQQLRKYTIEFSSKTRSLIALLEDIIISGDQFATYEKSVNKTYEECSKCQAQLHVVRRELMKHQPHFKIDAEACKLDRWTHVAEALLRLINSEVKQRSDNSEPLRFERDFLEKLFTYFCVYGSRSLCVEAGKFLTKHLGADIQFPLHILKTFFSTNNETTKINNLFPQQEIFSILHDMMDQDNLRFFYIDELFKLLEEATTSIEKLGELTPTKAGQSVDVQFLSWLLLMLSKLVTKSDKGVAHKGSKCRSCGMSPIIGARFRCVNCVDYDLCSQCEAKRVRAYTTAPTGNNTPNGTGPVVTHHEKSHVCLKIANPLPLSPQPQLQGLSQPNDPILPLLYANVSSSTGQSIHTGVTCDGCGTNPIKGIRYKCSHCDEFNFCETCEAKGVEHYPLHLFLKLLYPLPTPPSNENPKALIPVLLHRGFYPSSPAPVKASPKKSGKKDKKESDDNNNDTETDTKLTARDYLRSSGSLVHVINESNNKLSQSADTPKAKDDSAVTDEVEEVSRFGGKHLRTIFAVMSSSVKMNPPSYELFFLVIQLWEKLVNRYTPDDIVRDVLSNPQFDKFLADVSHSSSPSVVRSTVIQLFDVLCNSETYAGTKKDTAIALRPLKDSLRVKVIKLLNQNSQSNIEFLLELCLVVTAPTSSGGFRQSQAPATAATAFSPVKDIPKKKPKSKAAKASATPLAKSAPESTSTGTASFKLGPTVETTSKEYSLDSISSFLVSYLIKSNSLGANNHDLRGWAAAFKLLHFVDPASLLSSQPDSDATVRLSKIFKLLLTAPAEIQSSMMADYTSLLSKLFSASCSLTTKDADTSAVLPSALMNTLITSLDQSVTNSSTSLFLRTLDSIKSHYSSISDKPQYSSDHMTQLLQHAATRLPSSLLPDEKSCELIKEVIDTIHMICNSSSFVSQRAALVVGSKELVSVIQWLAKLPAESKKAKKAPSVTRYDVKNSLVELLKVLCMETESAKYIIDACLQALKQTPTSHFLPEIIQTLLTTEQLTHYFATELKGYSFIVHQLQGNSIMSSTLPNVAKTSLASLINSTTPSTTSNSATSVSTSSISKMENLGTSSTLLSPKFETNVKLLLSGSSSQWAYTFQPPVQSISLVIQLPKGSILKEIYMDVLYNSNYSRVPDSVTVETGVSQDRMILVGNFPLEFSEPVPPTNAQMSHTFKLQLPDPQAVNFVEISFMKPRNGNSIAVSKLQLLGYASLLSGGFSTPRLPNLTALKLLTQCVKYETVQSFMVKQKETPSFIEYMLSILSDTTLSYVQSIVFSFIKHDPSLMDNLLRLLLNGQTQYHANLAGKLCGLNDDKALSQTEQLSKLRDFVFSELSVRSGSLNSNLVPFLQALASAMASYQRKYSKISLPVNESELALLFELVLDSYEGSFMQQGTMQLLSTLVNADEKHYEFLLNKFYVQSNRDLMEQLLLDHRSPLRYLGILSSCSSQTAKQFLNSTIMTSILQHIQQCIDSKVPVQNSQAILEKALNFLSEISHHKAIKDWVGVQLFPSLLTLYCTKSLSGQVKYAIQDVFRACSNLDPNNQNQIANYLLKLMNDPSVNQQLGNPNSPREATSANLTESLLYLIVDMFALQDHVVLHLHPKNNSEEELQCLSNLNSQPSYHLTIDRETTHSSVDIDNTGTLLTINNTGSSWRTAIAEKPITQGCITWEVVVERTTSTSNIMIGVAEKNHLLSNYIGQTVSHQGWAYYGYNGNTYHDGASATYSGKKMKSGDVVSVTLDMDEGTLRFAHNGEEFAPAFSSGLLGRELYPAVSLYDASDSVRFNFLAGRRSSKHSTDIKMIKLDSRSPLCLQREGPLYTLPSLTKLDTISEALLPADDKFHKISFQLVKAEQQQEQTFVFGSSSNQTLDGHTTLGELISTFDNGTEIIDLTYEIKPVVGFTFGTNQAKDVVPSSSKISSVLKIFAEQNGLSLLLESIVQNLKKYGAEPEAPTTPPTEQKKAKPDKIKPTREEWIEWLNMLKLLIKVDGYVDLFAECNSSQALLFEVMLQNLPGIFISEAHSLPKPTDDSLANPLQPLLSNLSKLFKVYQKKGHQESLQFRQKIFESGLLQTLLSYISELCDLMPRDQNCAAFADVVDRIRQKRESKRKAAQALNQTTSGGKYWAKGTGYGTSADESSSSAKWNHAQYVKQQTLVSSKIAFILETIANYVDIAEPVIDDGSATDSNNNNNNTNTEKKLFSEEVYELLRASAVVPVIESYLHNDSLLDMCRFQGLYDAVMKATRALFNHESLAALADDLPGQSSSLFTLLSNLHAMADVVIKRFSKGNKTTPTKGGKATAPKTPEEGDELRLAKDIEVTFQLVKRRVEQHRKEEAEKLLHSSNGVVAPVVDLSFEEMYKSALVSHQFSETDMTNEDTGEYKHHYKSRIVSDINISSKKMKRLVQEIGSLSTGLPLHPDSSVFLRVDCNRVDVMQCIITGPRNTPYDNGVFQFDIYCPPEYPTTPPVVNLQTTGGGSVRFNPNLYNCGKVCLSLLGTWSGSENEKWNENTSTLLQVFISIQSLIFVEKPYFNEPGYESSMHTENGQNQSNLYNENIRSATLRWAIIEQIVKPSPGFEEPIKIHFKLKKDQIMKQCHEWLADAEKSKTSGFYDKMKQLVQDVEKHLNSLN